MAAWGTDLGTWVPRDQRAALTCLVAENQALGISDLPPGLLTTCFIVHWALYLALCSFHHFS